MPADTINFDACSKETSKYIRSFLGNISKKPLVGFGVVGTKTAELLLSQANIWHQKTDKKLTLTAVSARDRTKDRGINLSGVDFEEDPVALAHRDDINIVIELIGGSDIVLDGGLLTK